MLRLIEKYVRKIDTAEDAKAFVDWLATSGTRAASSVNRYLDILKPTAPDLFREIPKLKGIVSQPPKPFTSEEVKRILRTLKDDRYYRHYYPYVVFLFKTGVRTSEAIGLRWTDVNLDEGTVYIGSSLARKGETRERVRKSTKTGKARLVPVDVATVALLRSIPRTNLLVFPSPTGKPIDDQSFRNRCWYKTLEKAGVEYRRPYNTRHTFISHALENGANPVAIAAITGHSVDIMFKKYSGLVRPAQAPVLGY